MAVRRLDNVGIVVDDLDAAIEYFEVLGLSLEGRAQIEGEWADQAVGLSGIRAEIAMLATPDGAGRLEISRYDAPTAVNAGPAVPNTIGFHRVMFSVDDLEATLAALRPLRGEVLGEVAQYQDVYRLCYVRGPAGIVIGLAQDLRQEGCRAEG